MFFFLFVCFFKACWACWLGPSCGWRPRRKVPCPAFVSWYLQFASQETWKGEKTLTQISFTGPNHKNHASSEHRDNGHFSLWFFLESLWTDWADPISFFASALISFVKKTRCQPPLFLSAAPPSVILCVICTQVSCIPGPRLSFVGILILWILGWLRKGDIGLRSAETQAALQPLRFAGQLRVQTMHIPRPSPKGT